MKIRISENRLRSMLCESVRQVLHETDWKTYLSARDKNDWAARMLMKLGYDAQHAKMMGNDFYDFPNNIVRAVMSKTGLDWDSAEAYIEQCRQHFYNRKNEFNDAAKDAFMRDFGYEDETGRLRPYDASWEGSHLPDFGFDTVDTNGQRFDSQNPNRPSAGLKAASERARKELSSMNSRPNPFDYEYHQEYRPGRGWGSKH